MKDQNALRRRVAALMPGGVPKYVRCYDNGGATLDRYTVVFTGRYTHKTGGAYWHLGMNSCPYHGIGYHGEDINRIDVNKYGFAPALGRKNHLGTRILFATLPQECQHLAISTYVDLWDLAEEKE